MHPDLEHLIALQRLDSAALDRQRALAEDAAKQKGFDERLTRCRDLLAAAKDKLTENQNARRTIEKDVAVHQGRLSKFRDQLMAVKTNVEYQAMQKEI
jgi:predicted  nucleic acid-binding Zn-ribbon protein